MPGFRVKMTYRPEKRPLLMLKVKAIWLNKMTFHRERSKVKVVALILTSLKLSSNHLCNFPFLRNNDFPDFQGLRCSYESIINNFLSFMCIFETVGSMGDFKYVFKLSQSPLLITSSYWPWQMLSSYSKLQRWAPLIFFSVR